MTIAPSGIPPERTPQSYQRTMGPNRAGDGVLSALRKDWRQTPTCLMTSPAGNG